MSLEAKILISGLEMDFFHGTIEEKFERMPANDRETIKKLIWNLFHGTQKKRLSFDLYSEVMDEFLERLNYREK